ncbi:ribonuclease H-like domain-containing protein [Tanacetum coccineum]
MQGTMQNKVDKEARFNNEFDQFVTEPGEAMVLVYNHFAQLMNDLERNDIIFTKVTINTKFLNCLQPEWLKANKLEKSHYPFALVARTSSSSRATTPYYVTHPSSVVDYDDDYQEDAIQNNSADPLTSAMILLAHAITQRFSNPTNNHVRTSSNTRNEAIVQEEIIEGNNVQNDAGNIQRTLQTTYSGTATNVQCYNFSEKGHYARNCPKPRNDFLFSDASRMEEIKELSANICLIARVQPSNFDSDEGLSYDSTFLSEVQIPSTSYVNPLFAKDAQEQIGSVEYDNNVQESYTLEQLAINAYKEADKQQIIVKKFNNKT